MSCFFITGCPSEHRSSELYQQQLFSFGTLIDISLITDSPNQARQVIDIISAEFDHLHAEWHPWKNGVLGKANQQFSRVKPFSVSPSLLSMIEQSQLLSEKSNGLFNPAIGQLIQLWQFDQIDNEQHPFKLPATEKIQGLLLKKPQMNDIIVHTADDNEVQITSRNPSVSLDFGAFAKGVAIERMISILQTNNIHNALINAGGDLKTIGDKHGKAWRIGIKNPAHAQDSTQQPVLAAVNLQHDESLFTSGDYERFFEFQGKRYHHIIDPRTGFPAAGTRSVTVLAKDAALADAASTALFIAGPEQWPVIARQLGIQYVMLIASDGHIYLSPPMAKRIELFTDANTTIVR